MHAYQNDDGLSSPPKVNNVNLLWYKYSIL
jgi:hypothetical protein